MKTKLHVFESPEGILISLQVENLIYDEKKLTDSKWSNAVQFTVDEFEYEQEYL
jgi:hypothetical protein